LSVSAPGDISHRVLRGVGIRYIVIVLLCLCLFVCLGLVVVIIKRNNVSKNKEQENFTPSLSKNILTIKGRRATI